ncbi:MAG: septal ring lytic transglycosylase RlpA family protein [Xanthobacteraceae bacterium]
MLATTAAQARSHGDLASFYSSGRVTASGEKFDKAALKAAHLSLPFGSIVKVVNKRNGNSVVVEINDRQPAKRTRRTIDLTPGAARVIGMMKRGVVPVQLEVAQVTRPQLNRAFAKLTRMIEAKEAATAAHAEVAPEPPPQRFQLAAAVPTETPHPLKLVGNVFKAYVESLVKSAGPHVRLTCADGTPFPEPLGAVLRRAAWDFGKVVEVISGYRSLAYNRALYGNRRKDNGHFVGDASQHIRCQAADIRIAGVSPARLHAWALHQPEVGGVGRYASNFIHIDIRPRLRGRVVTWDWRGGRKFARRHHNHRHHARA